MPSIVALIPARAGSRRIPGKNTKDFLGHPLIAYTIHAALESGIFRRVYVSSEDARTREIAQQYGASTIVRRADYAADDAPDIGWVREALEYMSGWPQEWSDAFAILRPTSPFRTADTIRRAWEEFRRYDCHSIRAVEPVTHHPGKMWLAPSGDGCPMFPVCPHVGPDGVAWHSSPTQTLPKVYGQNASLEMAWTKKTVIQRGSISGDKVLPFFTEGYEGFDLNSPDDWTLATSLVDRGLVALPTLAPQTPTTPS